MIAVLPTPGAPLQHLNGPTNFIVPADNRVEFSIPRPLSQVNRVFFQCLAALLCVGAVHTFTAAHLADRRIQRLGRHAAPGESTGHVTAGLQHRGEDLFAGDIAVAGFLCPSVAEVEHPTEVLRQMNFASGAAHRRELPKQALQLLLQHIEVGAAAL